jgi:hypothetical protein
MASRHLDLRIHRNYSLLLALVLIPMLLIVVLGRYPILAYVIR